jgi:photosystem II stability/assembly factor-like uncharacterized protein
MSNTPRTILTVVCILWSVVWFSHLAVAGWVRQNSGTVLNLNDVTSNHSEINEAWACGDSGIILHTTNGGTTWRRQLTGTTRNLYSLAFIEVERGPVICVGDSGTVLRTYYEDSVWQQIPVPTRLPLRCVSDDGSTIVGDSGIILDSRDIGLSWSVEVSPTTERLNAVTGFFTPATIAGDNGVVLRQVNFPSVWQLCTTGTTADLFGIPMFASANISVGEGGLVLRSTDFGVHWTPQATPTQATLRAVEFSVNNTSHIYCVGDSGTIIKSTNEGVLWRKQPTGTTANLRGVFFYLDDENGWAVGDSGTILRTRDGGAPLAIHEPGPETPHRLSLHQNYPNPFNPATQIAFDLDKAGSVQLTVFNTLGQKVAALVNGPQSAGRHTVTFKAAELPSGVYLCRLHTESGTEQTKMLLLK